MFVLLNDKVDAVLQVQDGFSKGDVMLLVFQQAIPNCCVWWAAR